MQRSLRLLLLAALLGLALGAGGPRCGLRGVPYVLQPGSRYAEGCLGALCDCPVADTDQVYGSMRLDEIPALEPGAFRIFGVRDVHWLVLLGERKLPITGSGFYTTGAPWVDQQRLILDLRVGDAPLERYDSGLVPHAGAFPRLAIGAASEAECFGTAFELRAAPLMPAAMDAPAPH